LNKTKYIDFVFEEILEKEDLDNLESTFLNLGFKKIYFVREIKNKLDLEQDFIVPSTKSKYITYEKAYLFYDISLLPKFRNQEKSIILGYGGNLKNNTDILSKERGISILLNPLSDKLAFDTASSNLCKENKIKVGFDLNYIRNKPLNSIKQLNFIISLLIKERIDLVIGSFARRKEELIDPQIALSFLLNFGIEEQTLERFLGEGGEND